MEKKRTYAGLDVLKGILSLIVMIRHLPIDNPYMTAFSCCAVPTFFIITGFLYGVNNPDNCKQYAFRQIKRMAVIYMLWTVIYLPFSILDYRHLEIWDGIRTYFQHFLFDGSYWHLWYIVSCIFGIIFFHYMMKKTGIRCTLIVSGLLFVTGVMGDTWSVVSDKNVMISSLFQSYRSLFLTTRNGFFLGMFFLALGFSIAVSKKTEAINITFLKYMLGTIGGVGCIIELMIIHAISGSMPRHLNMMFFTVPVSIFWLIYFSEKDWKFDSSKVRKMSTAVYLDHVWVYRVVSYTGRTTHSLGVTVFFDIILTFMISVIFLFLGERHYRIKKLL